MNMIDRSFSAEAAYIAAKLAAARRRGIALLVGLALTGALATTYVWVTTLCGNCGAPV
jgi:hypothetical protein